MRTAFCQSMITLYERQPFVFLTGDLGYGALEPLRDVMGDRFINAGVAEQNMVTMAAGLAGLGFLVWVYSIAPFCYARPFEQIRNDVCMHGLPVVLVGNGGGYGYGIMGPSHHALEDYGVLLTLPALQAVVPAFRQDLEDAVAYLAGCGSPAYLRLGRCECPGGYQPPPFAPWRQLTEGGGPVVVAVGPLAGSLLECFRSIPTDGRPELWSLSVFSLGAALIPADLRQSLIRKARLLVAEEHVAQGSVGQAMAYAVVKEGMVLQSFRHHCAVGYPSGLYGSQSFHRRESGLDPDSILDAIRGL
jgi:transketolase